VLSDSKILPPALPSTYTPPSAAPAPAAAPH